MCIRDSSGGVFPGRTRQNCTCPCHDLVRSFGLSLACGVYVQEYCQQHEHEECQQIASCNRREPVESKGDIRFKGGEYPHDDAHERPSGYEPRGKQYAFVSSLFITCALRSSLNKMSDDAAGERSRGQVHGKVDPQCDCEDRDVDKEAEKSQRYAHKHKRPRKLSLHDSLHDHFHEGCLRSGIGDVAVPAPQATLMKMIVQGMME